MNRKEYFDAENGLKASYKTLTESAPQARIFRKALEEYFEFLITVRGHAWCMDVQSERKKMARLLVGVSMNVIALEDKVKILGRNEKLIQCRCGKGTTVRLLGGQYEDSYAGRCTCGKGWLLVDWPAKLPF